MAGVQTMRPVDLLKTNAAGALLESGFDVSALRPVRGVQANGLLREEDWEDIDAAVIRESRGVLSGVADLRSRGLIHNLGSIGVLISQYETLSEFSEATEAMSPLSESERDKGNFALVGVPVPVVFKDFDVDMRQAAARDRGEGESLDTTYAELATRKVAEKLEDALFNGGTITLNGNTAAGYTSHADRNTFTITTAWDAVTDNDEIVNDVLALKQANVDDDYRDQFILYIPGNYETVMDEDLDSSSGSGETVRERILRVQGIQDIQTSLALADDNVILVSLRSDVVDWAEAQDITPTQWDIQGGLGSRFKVMAVAAPRVKSTQGNKSGVAHGSV